MSKQRISSQIVLSRDVVPGDLFFVKLFKGAPVDYRADHDEMDLDDYDDLHHNETYGIDDPYDPCNPCDPRFYDCSIKCD